MLNFADVFVPAINSPWFIFFFVIYILIPSLILATIITITIWFIRSSKKQKSPSFLFLKSLGISALALIIVFQIYDYYLANRTGANNPYTSQCISRGYAGAKGDGCYGATGKPIVTNLTYIVDTANKCSWETGKPVNITEKPQMNVTKKMTSNEVAQFLATAKSEKQCVIKVPNSIY